MYWHELHDVEQDSNLISDPLTSGPRPLTYRQFVNLVGEVLAAVWGEEWRNQYGPRAPVSREMTTPYIAYSLRRRYPSEEPKGNSEPRLRGHLKDPKSPQNTYEVYGQLFDYLIEFNCSAPSPAKADELAESCDDFMISYRPFFIREGARKLFLLEQGADYWEEAQKEATFYRPLIYFVRLDRVIAVATTILESVTAHVNLSSADSE